MQKGHHCSIAEKRSNMPYYNTVLIETVPEYHIGDFVTVLDHMNPYTDRNYANTMDQYKNGTYKVCAMQYYESVKRWCYALDYIDKENHRGKGNIRKWLWLPEWLTPAKKREEIESML